eukprot:TRINITY_DN108809_c0_g1_i1.p1 TRINITY_DN108809_c0_g1~~TRINITY_DN108809_c0_g1_i1.p1  ORF type:complete len:237 (-),score=34.25 TRINITY_DN108809_c0_g1_i1:142-783(-)
MAGLVAGDPAKQWEWHESYRDQVKNMYRTSYSDMAHGRETYVKSDFPAGYGGHVISMRHDMLHRNTAVHRNMMLMRSDPSRDAFPSFKPMLDGVPGTTKHPSGARKNPTKGVVPHDGTTTMLKPPWGIMSTKRDPLNYRAAPPTMKTSQSSPSLRGAGAMMAQGMASQMSEPSLQQSSPSGEGLKLSVQMANEHAKAGTIPHESEILGDELGM